MGPAALLSIVLATASTGAAEATSCALISDDSARLQCYDQFFRRDLAAGSQASATDAPVTGDGRGDADAAAVFGLTAGQLRERSAAGQPIDSLRATVAEVEPSRNGRPVIRLANGQRWAVREATDRPAFAAGDVVEIRAAALGSYLASVPGSGRPALRVQRIE